VWMTAISAKSKCEFLITAFSRDISGRPAAFPLGLRDR
jgi:hypothetical protein